MGRMCAQVVAFRSRPAALLVVLALCGIGCGDESYAPRAPGGAPSDDASAGGAAGATADTDAAPEVCGDLVYMDGDFLVEHEEDVTARFRVGETYDKTVMLFGGEPIEFDNAVSNVYIIGLDKQDALMLAEQYADFYLCSSPGGQAAQAFILAYDLVPATCEVYDKIVAALTRFHQNNVAGGDRTSLRFDGAPLEVESVIVDATGEDVTDQLLDRNFHLVTDVEELSGESVLAFGSAP